jgi:hypothetical protein
VPLIVAQTSESTHTILNSWKEIAVYLDCGLRTVQRWEHNFDMPVHRIGKGKRSPVYANVAELNFGGAASPYQRTGTYQLNRDGTGTMYFSSDAETLILFLVDQRSIAVAVAKAGGAGAGILARQQLR